MKKVLRIYSVALIPALLCVNTTLAATAKHGMVASVNPLATEAGVNVLKSGGNAIDAAVATGLTLGVVDTRNSGIGGGCFMLIHLANGSNICVDGREVAPSAATKDMFVRNGKGDPQLSQTGALASGVPGELSAFDYAVSHFGKKKLAELIAPAAELAEHGFPLTQNYAGALKSEAADLARFPSSTNVFFKDGHVYSKVGEIFREPDLAQTYRSIAASGPDWFYRGPFAQAVQSWMQSNGGIMTADDLAHYHAEIREPVQSTYRGFNVVSFPPPSSGGVHVLEILNILENFDLKQMDAATRLHVTAEAMKLAFADRAFWLGDPEFTPVPRGLIDKSYAKSLAAKIDVKHTTPVSSHGEPPDAQSDIFKKHTTHFSVADEEGNWVACTATINTTFGSKVVIPGTGVVMNNQMDDFSIQPGVPNAFGLIGGDANAVAPGKRPLSSMSPTIVFKDGQPILALGAAGGPTIISAVFQEIIDMLDLGESPAEALRTARIHQQWSPDQLDVEKTLPAPLKEALAERGHKIHELNAMAVSQIVARSTNGDGFVGEADPRAGGKAAGW